MRGRTPKPTALKLLDGTRSDRINRNEPAIPPGSIEPPDWLNEIARGHWTELAPVLQSAGLLTVGDRQTLALLCEAFSRFRIDPANDKARDLYRRLSVEFDLTPSSRSRLKTTAEPARDALAEFLARRTGHSSTPSGGRS
jgi:phage terminase small subunit